MILRFNVCASEMVGFVPARCSSGVPRAGVTRGRERGALNAGQAWILGGERMTGSKGFVLDSLCALRYLGLLFYLIN